jgi:hypothetical protein
VVLPATAKGAWKPHWVGLLGRFKRLVPPHPRVIVLADRGLYAKWLFQAIVALGWHPFLRINPGNADFKPDGGGPSLPLSSLLGGVGGSYHARGVMFRSRKARLPSTLLACWGDGYRDGWFVLTDLPEDQADSAWYGLRGWIERGFKHAKSGGWNWQMTRITDPARASRQWLAMAAAAMLLVRHGAAGEIGESRPPRQSPGLPGRQDPAPEPTPRQRASANRPSANRPSANRRRPPRNKTAVGPPSKPAASSGKTRTPRRILSIFRQGLLLVQSALLANLPLPPGAFVPEPWPQSTTTSPSPVAADQPP